MITAGFCVLSLIISWGIIYHRLSGLFPFLRNIIIMSSGNLSATALNTPNNWWILGTCFILFASFPFIARNKKINLLYIISALAFFGIFKYSFAREEELHMVQLLYFMMFLSTFCIILFAELKPVHIIWLMVPLMLYNINMQLSNRYHLGDQVQILGINNFRTLLLNFSATKQKSIENSEMNIRKSKLPDSFLNKIKDQTVDCYPWELSYIPANGLNYKPRPLIQLGCVNSTILDAENALFFESPEAPKFIIWHHAWCSDRLCSIDERYLLNEDALATYQLLNHYEIVDSSENILLLERTTRERLEKPSHVSSSNYQWNEWIPVTTVDPSSIVLAKPIFQKSFIGKLKSFLYKEKEYFIEYKLTDGQIFRHRFVPDDAISGVWMSPYLVNLSNGLGGTTVKEVRFIATDNMRMLVNKIELEWMVIRKK